ncbi:TetR/AcrR family transcriptional regulator [uncultured Microbacterium sp.]|uniref:Regulatory protein TetR n=1 Tax=uncultured Microbacterium sp. TaxID=191216 RepID=A0A1Y5NVV2_9MICO|nr:TetR family transcriptional regulator [uncultured Microbacterium sp.]SBS70514.1 Regulatory protein TetR [uncultured Microbacterium sp.]
MSRPARARDSVLEAYERLLIEEGPRGATMEATAAAAGVSKGGLLYHFASKEALEKGLLERMEALAALDLEEMSAAPEGLIAAFLRTSVMDGSPIDRALIAGSKLAQTASPLATEALRRVRELWAGALRPHARDETAVQLVLLVCDGLYFNNALGTGAVPGPIPEGAEMDALIALVERAASA